MLSTSRTLLRLHIEAVWGVQLPPITHDTVTLLHEGTRPPWKLYLAELTDERIAIWRPDVVTPERAALLEQASEALTLSLTEHISLQIKREVALHQVASPIMDIATAQRVARLLTPDDSALVERFDPGEVEYYFHPECRPLVGVVVDGRLLSLAHSSRRTARACELGINTLPEARRRGYALAATLLWAASIVQEGLIPFYSAFAENTASLGLASAAGYRAFARGVMLED
ncbi:MAG TPA: GNAT family N-acetyltransferase [Ktedonobacteraceae bacterium]|nr:GNAT family N-acetyltransferase [Ktedonobacteraceae bacterium]